MIWVIASGLTRSVSTLTHGVDALLEGDHASDPGPTTTPARSAAGSSAS